MKTTVHLAFWTLVVLIIALAVIGFLHLTRGTVVRHVQAIDGDCETPAVSEPQFPLTVMMLTGSFVTRLNRVDVTLNGDGTYPRLWQDLRSAQHSITLQLYYGAPGRMATMLGDICASAPARACASSCSTTRAVRAPTRHAKTFVVDGEWATIGSMNFDNRSLALNDEATLMVLDRGIGNRMEQTFLDDLGDSEEITVSHFRQRSWIERLAERAAHLITPLL